MKIAVHQPHYLPWLGYLAKWAAADVLVFLDTVQYEKNGWQNRNRIRTADGAQWLTVPVHAHLGTPIGDVAVDATQPWRARHLRAIEHAYARAPHVSRHQANLRALLDVQWTRLVDLAVASAAWLAQAVGIATPTRLASTLGVDGDDATGRLVAICKALGADTYLAGAHGARYMDAERFREAGIGVLYQHYEHPVYPQQHGEFVPFLSGVDLLLNHGDESLSILRRGDSWGREP
ncbi:MAG TPA: WbqC family protein [Methylomirabilota bacterium]|nr:WbqC family protein [Methylomirabilota bacterium]